LHSACKLLVFGPARSVTALSVTLCNGYTLCRIPEKHLLREHSAHVTPSHARPAPLCGVLRPPIGFLSSRARCARPRALWRAILHTARPFLWVCINQHPQHDSSRSSCTLSTRVSFRYVPVRTSSTQQPHTEHSYCTSSAIPDTSTVPLAVLSENLVHRRASEPRSRPCLCDSTCPVYAQPTEAHSVPSSCVFVVFGTPFYAMLYKSRQTWTVPLFIHPSWNSLRVTYS